MGAEKKKCLAPLKRQGTEQLLEVGGSGTVPIARERRIGDDRAARVRAVSGGTGEGVLDDKRPGGQREVVGSSATARETAVEGSTEEVCAVQSRAGHGILAVDTASHSAESIKRS